MTNCAFRAKKWAVWPKKISADRCLPLLLRTGAQICSGSTASISMHFSADSGAVTNLKVGGGTSDEKRWKTFCCALHFFGFRSTVQLVVLMSAFVMVSTVWSVSCLLFYSQCPRARPFVKVGDTCLWSWCQWLQKCIAECQYLWYFMINILALT